MIIYRKKPFDFKVKNIIVLDAGLTDGYIYVSKDTFEQAVSLAITFSKDHERIERALGKAIDGWKITTGIFTTFRKISETLPYPINMLSTYIGLASDSGINWQMTDDEEICETVCGILHTISQFADFYSMALVPFEQRTKLDIPKHVYLSYKESWETLLGDIESNAITISGDDLNAVVRAAVDGCMGESIDEKVKEGLSNFKLPETQAPNVNVQDIENLVSAMVAEKINMFIGTELPKLIAQQVQNAAPMMHAFNQPNPYQPMYQNPYQSNPMYQQGMYQPNQYQPIPQPPQQIQPQPLAQPEPIPIPQPIQTAPIPQPVQVAPTPQPVVETVQPVVQTVATVEEDIVEGDNVADIAEIEAMIAAINAEYDEKLQKDLEGIPEPGTPAKPEEPKILTEDVRKERDIASESIKIINNYDI